MSTLYIKVSISRRPISGRPRAVRLMAGFDPQVRQNTALCYAELGFAQFSQTSVDEIINRFKAETRSSVIEVKMERALQEQLLAG